MPSLYLGAERISGSGMDGTLMNSALAMTRLCEMPSRLDVPRLERRSSDDICDARFHAREGCEAAVATTCVRSRFGRGQNNPPPSKSIALSAMPACRPSKRRWKLPTWRWPMATTPRPSSNTERSSSANRRTWGRWLVWRAAARRWRRGRCEAYRGPDPGGPEPGVGGTVIPVASLAGTGRLK
jgi:hypothetical protein